MRCAWEKTINKCETRGNTTRNISEREGGGGEGDPGTLSIQVTRREGSNIENLSRRQEQPVPSVNSG